MISFRALRPGHTDPRPRSGPLETSGPRRHHGAGHQAVPTPERTMSPVRQKNIALVGKAAIRERKLTNLGWLLVTHRRHRGSIDTQIVSI